MGKYWLSYSTWSGHIDRWRGYAKKPIRSDLFKILLYPVYVLIIIDFCILFAMLLPLANSARNNSKPHHDRTRYKRVVKEGILWDSIEYHQI